MADNPAPLGAPCWIDLNTSDLDRAVQFYGELFGWTAEDGGEDYGHYHNFSKDGALVAGLMRKQPEAGYPDFWMTYLSSADAKATAAAAASEAGGQVMLEPMAVMDLGAMAVLGDPPVAPWACGSRDGTGATRRTARPVRPCGTRCTPATTTARWRSTSGSSAGTPRRSATPTSSATPR